MKTQVVVFFVVLAVSVTLSAISQATCVKSYVCDNWGQNCRYQDICDSNIDLPSTNLQPLPSLPSTQLKPLPSMNLPPLGTSKCEYKQVNGVWQNVCY